MRKLFGLIVIGSLAIAGCDRFDLVGVSAPSDDPHYSAQQFQDMVAEPSLVLVKFGAPWCGPCRMVDEELPDVTGDLKILSVNVDNNEELSAQYKISGIPQMILFRDGEPVDKLVGYHSAEEISDWAAKFASTAGSSL